MANAKPAVTRAGFEIYRLAARDLSLDEINEKLRTQGLGPISARTHGHYKKLLKAGFNRYISINRFDVARSSRVYGSLSLLGRYRYRATNTAVHVKFIKDETVTTVSGRVTEAGDVGALIRFTESDAATLVALKLRLKDNVIVEYLEQDRSILSTIVSRGLRSDNPFVEIEYSGLTSLAEVIDLHPLSLVSSQVILRTDDAQINTLDIVGWRLHLFFELLEGIRSLVNEAGEFSVTNYYMAPPTVKRLTISSPMTLMLDLPTLVPHLVLLLLCLKGGSGVLHNLAKARKQWHEGTSIKLSNESAKREQDIAHKQQLLDACNETLEILRRMVPDTRLTTEQIRSKVEQDIVPPMRRLEAVGVVEIDVNSEEDSEARPST